MSEEQKISHKGAKCKKQVIQLGSRFLRRLLSLLPILSFLRACALCDTLFDYQDCTDSASASRAAAIVSSMSASEWATETKNASNWLHGM